MLVAIHQPHYLPWLGYLDKADRADLFVLLDHVNFDRGGWQNRNYVLTADGPRLLSVPMAHGGTRLSIDRTELGDRTRWRRRHHATIVQSYAAAPHIAAYRGEIADFYVEDPVTLGDLACASAQWTLRLFGIATPCVRSSRLGSLAGRKSALLLEICRAVGASAYLSGDGAAYLGEEAFAGAGLTVVAQRFRHPRYAQAGGRRDFVPNLAALDLLVNAGPDALRILRHANDR